VNRRSFCCAKPLQEAPASSTLGAFSFGKRSIWSRDPESSGKSCVFRAKDSLYRGDNWSSIDGTADIPESAQCSPRSDRF